MKCMGSGYSVYNFVTLTFFYPQISQIKFSYFMLKKANIFLEI